MTVNMDQVEAQVSARKPEELKDDLIAGYRNLVGELRAEIRGLVEAGNMVTPYLPMQVRANFESLLNKHKIDRESS